MVKFYIANMSKETWVGIALALVFIIIVAVSKKKYVDKVLGLQVVYIEKTILEYGIVGVILLYFLWKDKSTFEMYKNTMQRMTDLLEAIQKEQSELKKDMEEIKKFIK